MATASATTAHADSRRLRLQQWYNLVILSVSEGDENMDVERSVAVTLTVGPTGLHPCGVRKVIVSAHGVPGSDGDLAAVEQEVSAVLASGRSVEVDQDGRGGWWIGEDALDPGLAGEITDAADAARQTVIALEERGQA